MITLNELAYNIKNIAYGGHATDESGISTKQIKFWIHYHRARLIAENLERGILDRPEIYQKISLNTYNCNASYLRDYIKNYKLYLKEQHAQPAVTGYLEYWPKDSNDQLLIEFIPHSSLVFGSGSQPWANAGVSDQFGQDLYSSEQERGDFRNQGVQGFVVPTPILFENTKGLSRVFLSRKVYTNDVVATNTENEQEYGWGQRAEMIRFKSHDDQKYCIHNKFDNHINQPYYHFSQLNPNSDNPSNRTIGGSNGETVLTIKNLQVSPNYHGNLDAPNEERVFYMYKASYHGIFEDPTNAAGPRYSGYNSASFNIYDHDNYGADSTREPRGWRDHQTNYPIPMDMVGDLIQRVIQSEIQPSLKTMPEIVPDKIDDTTKMKISGAQVQR